MMDLTVTLLNIFGKLDQNKICRVSYDLNKLVFQQEGFNIESNGIYYDYKRDTYISPKDISHNMYVLGKLMDYKLENLICYTPNKFGFYVQVFNYLGRLIYAQYIRLGSTNRLQTWYLNKKYPEVRLKTRYL